MKKYVVTLLFLVLAITASAICESAYTQITQEEAARIMEEETGYLIVDVRTEEEYDEDSRCHPQYFLSSARYCTASAT